MASERCHAFITPVLFPFGGEFVVGVHFLSEKPFVDLRLLEVYVAAVVLIERLIRESAVVGFDESGCYVNGKLNWSWIAQTTYLNLMFRGAGRGSKVLEERFGDLLKNMVAVTDLHSAYFAINFLNNQICLAHMLRNLEYLNDIDKEQTWAKEVQALLREAIHLRNEKPAEIIPKKLAHKARRPAQTES